MASKKEIKELIKNFTNRKVTFISLLISLVSVLLPSYFIYNYHVAEINSIYKESYNVAEKNVGDLVRDDFKHLIKIAQLYKKEFITQKKCIESEATKLKAFPYYQVACDQADKSQKNNKIEIIKNGDFYQSITLVMWDYKIGIKVSIKIPFKTINENLSHLFTKDRSVIKICDESRECLTLPLNNKYNQYQKLQIKKELMVKTSTKERQLRSDIIKLRKKIFKYSSYSLLTLIILFSFVVTLIKKLLIESITKENEELIKTKKSYNIKMEGWMLQREKLQSLLMEFKKSYDEHIKYTNIKYNDLRRRIIDYINNQEIEEEQKEKMIANLLYSCNQEFKINIKEIMGSFINLSAYNIKRNEIKIIEEAKGQGEIILAIEEAVFFKILYSLSYIIFRSTEYKDLLKINITKTKAYLKFTIIAKTAINIKKTNQELGFLSFDEIESLVDNNSGTLLIKNKGNGVNIELQLPILLEEGYIKHINNKRTNIDKSKLN